MGRVPGFPAGFLSGELLQPSLGGGPDVLVGMIEQLNQVCQVPVEIARSDQRVGFLQPLEAFKQLLDVGVNLWVLSLLQRHFEVPIKAWITAVKLLF